MTIKECSRGHMYDADLYPQCPYCSSQQSVIDFDQMPVGSAGETQAPAGYGRPVSSAGETQAPAGYGRAVGAENHTLPPQGWEKKVTEQQHTMPVVKIQSGKDPVVGWLVCVEGRSQGKDYRLRSKINTIGRSSAMDVCIADDPTVTQEVHAKLAYDPKHNGYNLIPGNNSNNIYVNDNPVYSPLPLHPYDVLEIGQTKLIFVPLCTDRFTWEGGLKQPEGL